MKVYLAGASKEIQRVTRWANKLRQFVEVVSTWPEEIAKVGQANPVDATLEQYKTWVAKDLAEVKSAHTLWLFIPEVETVGAYTELGYAYALDKLIVMSGKHRPIFTPALANYHSPYDAEVAEYLIDLAAKGDHE